MARNIRSLEDLPIFFDRLMLMQILRCSEQTLRNYERRKDNPLPCHRPSRGTILYSKDEVISWIMKQ